MSSHPALKSIPIRILLSFLALGLVAQQARAAKSSVAKERTTHERPVGIAVICNPQGVLDRPERQRYAAADAVDIGGQLLVVQRQSNAILKAFSGDQNTDLPRIDRVHIITQGGAYGNPVAKDSDLYLGTRKWGLDGKKGDEIQLHRVPWHGRPYAMNPQQLAALVEEAKTVHGTDQQAAFEAQWFASGVEEHAGAGTWSDHYGSYPGPIPKEQIDVILRQMADWTFEHILKAEAVRLGVPTVARAVDLHVGHYWDGGLLTKLLIDREKAQVVHHAMINSGSPILAAGADTAYGVTGRYRLGMQGLAGEGQNLFFALGEIVLDHFQQHGELDSSLKLWLAEPQRRALKRLADIDRTNPARMELALEIGRSIADNLRAGEMNQGLLQRLRDVSSSVWMPHSLGPIKEFNVEQLGDERAVIDNRFTVRRIIETALVQDETTILASTSPAIRQALLVDHRARPDRIVDALPGVDHERYVPRDLQDPVVVGFFDWLKQEKGISEEALTGAAIVATTGRISSDFSKGHLDFAATAPEVVKRLQAAGHSGKVLFLVGGAGQKHDVAKVEEAAEQAREAGAEIHLLKEIPNAHMAGFMAALGATGGAFVLASRMEGWGITNMEAAAAGAAVVASNKVPSAVYFGWTDVADLRKKKYKDGHAAIVAKIGDIAGYADAIAHLLMNPEERDARARAGREYTLGLDWDAQVVAMFQASHRRHKGDE